MVTRDGRRMPLALSTSGTAAAAVQAARWYLVNKRNLPCRPVRSDVRVRPRVAPRLPASRPKKSSFHRRAAERGDLSRQQLNCDLDLTMSIRQAGQIVQQQKQLVQRQQQRELTILKVSANAPQQAQVKYDNSVVTLKSAEQEPQSSRQPVTGKTYFVTREGEKLSITYPDGSQPSEEERLIVQENMDTFGLPNPIATFFDGKPVRVGQTLQLPTELARDLLGFAATGDTVSQFGLKLVEVRPPPQAGCLAAGRLSRSRSRPRIPNRPGVSMTLTGQMVMEVQTCRTLACDAVRPRRGVRNARPGGGAVRTAQRGTDRGRRSKPIT